METVSNRVRQDYFLNHLLNCESFYFLLRLQTLIYWIFFSALFR